jgi:hypothetical protein
MATVDLIVVLATPPPPPPPQISFHHTYQYKVNDIDVYKYMVIYRTITF